MSVSAYQFYNSCQPPLTSLSSSFLFYVLTQHQKSNFPAAKGSFTLQGEQKVPLLEGTWLCPRRGHVWDEPLQPLTSCTFGIWQSGTSKYTCFYMPLYLYIYTHTPKTRTLKKKATKRNPPKIQTKTWTYTKNKAPQTITTINPLLKCWHPTWIAKEGRVKQLLFLF